MQSVVLVVLQSEAEADLGTALAALPGARCYVVRPPDLAGAAPPAGAEVLTAPAGDREQAAVAARRVTNAETVVVLEAGERVSPELAAELVALATGPPGAYRAQRVHRFLGRDVAGGTVTMAWRGDPESGAAHDLQGALVVVEPDIAAIVARLDARATRVAAARPAGTLRDLAARPLTALLRRLTLRYRDGVPGLILSVLESYGEVLAAAKAWERSEGPARAPRRGALPVGFSPVATRRGWAVVRDGTGERLMQTLLDATPDDVEGEPWTRGGRGATWALAVDGHTRAVLRWYRRGGALRHLIRDRYFGWRARPLTELLTTEAARRHGVPAVEVLAVRVDRLGGGFYRGAIVTRAIERAETLAEVVMRRPHASERAATIEAVARAVSTMHDRGVHHRDLNAANILVQRDGDRIAVHLIDFDRATIRTAVTSRQRRQALRRLERSLAKLDPRGTLVGADDRAAFHRAYRGEP